MIRVFLAPAMLGLAILACNRDHAGAAAMNRDTLVTPAAGAPNPAPAAPAPNMGGDTANAAKPDMANAPSANAPAPAVPPPATSAKSDTPPGKPNIHPQSTREPPKVPQDGATLQDTSAAAPLRDAYHQAPRDTVSQAVYDGWKQFNLNCARCHGEDVTGTTIAPHLVESLKPDGPINTKELFIQTVCHGRPEKGMPAWCPLGLDTAKIEQLYAYVKGRSDGKIGPGRPAVRP
jgi:mono/diheme cytochrome c family protein